MMYVGCLFALIALAAMVPMLVDLSGSTAIIFSFIGMPALGIALALYAVDRWRAGAFRIRNSADSPPHRS